jgi:hypothetical protein
MRSLATITVTMLVAGTASADPATWVKNKFQALSHKNNDTRVLHRPGEAYQGTLHAPAGSPFGAGAKPVTVRLSRGANAAEPKKDFLGMAVRVPRAGGSDDLLLVSSGNGTIGRRVPSRAGSFFEKGYSSITPFQVDGQKYVVRAVPTAPAQALPRTGTDLNQLHQAVGGPATFHLELQGVHGAPSRPLGDITLDRPMTPAESDGLKFQIWNNQVVRPTGVVNAVRKFAYEGSQSTR